MCDAVITPSRKWPIWETAIKMINGDDDSTSPPCLGSAEPPTQPPTGLEVGAVHSLDCKFLPPCLSLILSVFPTRIARRVRFLFSLISIPLLLLSTGRWRRIEFGDVMYLTLPPRQICIKSSSFLSVLISGYAVTGSAHSLSLSLSLSRSIDRSIDCEISQGGGQQKPARRTGG